MDTFNNNNNGFSQQGLDLTNVYGLDNNSINNGSSQSLEHLTGYNLNDPMSNMNMNSNNTRQPMYSNGRSMNNGQQNWNGNTMQPAQSNGRMINNTNENRDNSSMQPYSEDVVNVNEPLQSPSMASEEAEDRVLNNRDTWTQEDEMRMNNLRTLGQNQALEDEVRSLQMNNNGQEQTFPSTSGQLSNNVQMNSQGNTILLPLTTTMTAFLRTQIGKNVRIQFLIGADTLVEKSGFLLGVGSNFILLRENVSGDVLLSDIDDVKFISVENNM